MDNRLCCYIDFWGANHASMFGCVRLQFGSLQFWSINLLTVCNYLLPFYFLTAGESTLFTSDMTCHNRKKTGGINDTNDDCAHLLASLSNTVKGIKLSLKLLFAPVVFMLWQVKSRCVPWKWIIHRHTCKSYAFQDWGLLFYPLLIF